MSDKVNMNESLIGDLRRWADRNDRLFSRTVSVRLMRRAADALERQQWRPVSEGLPEPLKVVLCLNESCGVIDRYVDDDHEWFNVPYWWKEKGGVTHWMPLPEPPQD